MDYPASTIILVKGKWYVSVTVPKALEHLFKVKQLRLSTGTSDRQKAKMLQHAKSAQIYERFDHALCKEKFGQERRSKQLMQALFDIWLAVDGKDSQRIEPWLRTNPSQIINIIDNFSNAIQSGGTFLSKLDEKYVHATEMAWEWNSEEIRLVTDHFREPEDRSIASLSGKEIDLEESDDRDTTTHISQLLPKYIEERQWTRIKTRIEFQSKIAKFIDVAGDLRIQEISKTHAYKFARHLEKEGKANKTIRSYVSAVRGLFEWCEQKGEIEQHSFVNLNLSNYGVKTQRYAPFSKDELFQLFRLNLPAQERLLLSILITTGMRLDEAALLTSDDMKVQDEIRYFDLTKALVKNSGSHRDVAIPSCLRLPALVQGRLFDYPLDADGKASRSASKALSPWIRKVTKDTRKVTHSLRGTLKDLLRDCDVSKEINDFITGHVGGDVASSYGTGPSLQTKFYAVDKVEHPWLIID